MLGVGVLITFALVVSALVYHKKYGKRRPNAVSHFSPNGRRDSRDNMVLRGPGMAPRMHMPGGHRGRGGPGTIVTPSQPGVYPSYSAPAHPAYGPYGAPPMPPSMIIEPPPYSFQETGSRPLGLSPQDLAPAMTLGTNTTPPPSYDDIIKDDPTDYPFDPPNYINTQPQTQTRSVNQSRTRTQNNRNDQNTNM